MNASNPDFDPYHKWLGIPPNEQPADHYRLLGISLFETDPDVIAAAADRQMGHVKSFATGPYAAHSQLLLNELAKAKVCLSNPQLKPIYDANLTKLRARERDELIASLNDVEDPPPAPMAAPPASDPSLEAVAALSKVPARGKRRHRRSPWLLHVAILLSSSLVVAGLLWYAKLTAPTDTPAEVAPVTAKPPKPTPNADPDPALVPEPPDMVARREPVRAVAPKPAAEVAVRPQPRIDLAVPNRNRLALRADQRRLDQPVQPVRPERITERAGDPFAEMPGAISLPPIEAGPVDLGQYGADILHLQLHLLVPEYLTRRGKMTFVMRRLRDPDGDLHWLVFDGSEDHLGERIEQRSLEDLQHVARLRIVDKQLRFEWTDAASSKDLADRLQFCMLHMSSGRYDHDLQFRLPVETPEPITLGNWDSVYKHRVELESIPDCPPISELRMRFSFDDGFPSLRSVNGDPRRLAADERLLMSALSADYAGIGAYWESKGKLIVVNVAPGFRVLAYPDDLIVLSRTRLERTEKKLARDKRTTEKEYKRRVAKRAALRRNLTEAQNINITLPGGGTTVQLRNQKAAAIAGAQTEITANEQRISELTKLSSLVRQDETIRLPALRSLAQELEGTARLGFELYLPAGKKEVVLYRQGPEPTATPNSPRSNLPQPSRTVDRPPFFDRWSLSSGRNLDVAVSEAGAYITIDEIYVMDLATGREVFSERFNAPASLSGFLAQYTTDASVEDPRWLRSPSRLTRWESGGLRLESVGRLPDGQRARDSSARVLLKTGVPRECEIWMRLVKHSSEGLLSIRVWDNLNASRPELIGLWIGGQDGGSVYLNAANERFTIPRQQKRIPVGLPFDLALRVSRAGIELRIDDATVVDHKF